MVQYFNDLDNRPDAVSSAHWRDYGACSSNDPRHKAMRNLPIPDNLALAYPLQHKISHTYGKYSLPVAISRACFQVHCNNITYQETKF